MGGVLVPGANIGNPTGLDANGIGSGTGVTQPALPTATSADSTAMGSTTVPGLSFPANGGATATNLQNLNVAQNLGFPSSDSSLQGELNGLFGNGVGSTFYNFLNSGAGYNPEVAGALVNQMAPYEERARNAILESFGGSGNRYSSPAAIGLADFESSFALGQQGILADQYNRAVNNYQNLFSGILDTAHLEQANKTNTADILSGIAGFLSESGILGTLLSKIPGLNSASSTGNQVTINVGGQPVTVSRGGGGSAPTGGGGGVSIPNTTPPTFPTGTTVGGTAQRPTVSTNTTDSSGQPIQQTQAGPNSPYDNSGNINWSSPYWTNPDGSINFDNLLNSMSGGQGVPTTSSPLPDQIPYEGTGSNPYFDWLTGGPSSSNINFNDPLFGFNDYNSQFNNFFNDANQMVNQNPFNTNLGGLFDYYAGGWPGGSGMYGGAFYV